jgi:hypothetical protein
VPQTDPAAVFGGVADIQGWTSAASGRYELAVRHPERAAPGGARALVGAGTAGTGLWIRSTPPPQGW